MAESKKTMDVRQSSIMANTQPLGKKQSMDGLQLFRVYYCYGFNIALAVFTIFVLIVRGCRSGSASWDTLHHHSHTDIHVDDYTLFLEA
jgi:hypothetical protein